MGNEQGIYQNNSIRQMQSNTERMNNNHKKNMNKLNEIFEANQQRQTFYVAQIMNFAHSFKAEREKTNMLLDIIKKHVKDSNIVDTCLMMDKINFMGILTGTPMYNHYLKFHNVFDNGVYELFLQLSPVDLMKFLSDKKNKYEEKQKLFIESLKKIKINNDVEFDDIAWSYVNDIKVKQYNDHIFNDLSTKLLTEIVELRAKYDKYILWIKQRDRIFNNAIDKNSNTDILTDRMAVSKIDYDAISIKGKLWELSSEIKK